MPIKIHSLIMIKKAKLRFTTESDYNIMKESVIYNKVWKMKSIPKPNHVSQRNLANHFVEQFKYVINHKKVHEMKSI